MNTVKIGTFTGNGAVKNISIGFVPDYVRITNVTDGDIIHEWFRTIQADGVSTDIAAAVAPNAADGISAYAGSSTAGQGFSVGTDISENAKVYGYVAMRNYSPG